MSLEVSQAQALRSLPKVQRLLETPEALAFEERFGRTRLVNALRTVLARERARLLAGTGAPAGPERLLGEAEAHLMALNGPRRVINAAGVVIHTNLGRAPLPQASVEAVAAAAGYCALEYDLDTGRRGRRGAGAETLLRERAGSEDALVVNNAAAAVLLALSALAAGGEVVVSRGELVEIGGGFRIPDVIAQGGARLVEVGTTNRTRLSDYEGALTPDTRVLLKVHPSNYRMTGFTRAVELAELSALARRRGLLLVHDLGAGALVDLAPFGLPDEKTPAASIAAGADVVAFSGDKLLGGPQAGLLAGRTEVIERLRRHPLQRALRADKLTLAALEAVLRLYEDPADAVREIPVLRQFAQSSGALQGRAARLSAILLEGGVRSSVEASQARVGGGAAPDVALESLELVLEPKDREAAELAARLRAGAPPACPGVVARLIRGQVRLDLFAVADEEVEELGASVLAALKAPLGVLSSGGGGTAPGGGGPAAQEPTAEAAAE